MKFYVFEDPVTGQVFVREGGHEGNLCEAFAWGNVSAKDNAFVIMKGVQAASEVAKDMLEEMQKDQQQWRNIRAKKKMQKDQEREADGGGDCPSEGHSDCTE